jgi:hypothetical protein
MGIAELAARIQDLIDELNSTTYRTPMWFPFPSPQAFDPGWNLDADLSSCLSQKASNWQANAELANVSMAIVDMSANPVSPRYAGFQDDVQMSIASTAKIAAMYAAYQLREDCRFLAQSLSTLNDPASVSQAVLTSSVAKWSDPANPAHLQAIAQSPPKLDQIFDFTQDNDGWHVDFRRTSAQTPSADPAPADAAVRDQIKTNLNSLDDAVDNSSTAQARRDVLRKVNFLEWLRLMVGFSNNVAAGFCIRSLGFPFIGALMQQAGLVDLNAGTGLWLAMDYDPMHAEDTWTGHLLAGIMQGGNAKMLAKFFTLLLQGSLVNGTASTEMLGLMDGDIWRGADSFLGANIQAGGGNRICTKIGILGNVVHDAGWIEHGALDYVAVVLNANDTGTQPIATADAAMEDCLSQ